ncbi:MAG: PQQ-binding-like beta-propeller repeat protein [Planctomycetes bacterium]|nr:PQQ-binding-like beta-propeller repeat protein [Planctomycetota bacterium]
MISTTILRSVIRTAICVLLGSAITQAVEPTPAHWPGFRGHRASGVAEGHKLPVEWDVESGKNVKWKRAIPGLAHSSVAIWGDRVFVTTAVSKDPNPYLRVGLYGESPDHPEDVEHDYRVYCLDKRSGRILWEKSAHKGIPKTKRHIKATHANCTPATDGKHVVAFFGSEGLYGYDINGKLLWEKDLGYLDSGPSEVADLQWGFASSPVIVDGRVYVVCATRNASFVAAYDVTSGSEIWRTPRPNYPGWHSPTVYTGPGPAQIITNGYKHMGGYALATGKELWKMHGGGDVPVPTPIIAHDLIYIANAHGAKSPVYAVRPTASGDITLTDGQTSSDHIAWTLADVRNYMQTPLVYGDYLYCCRNSGILSCHNAKTGEKVYKQRLASGVGFTASPVAGDGKIYFASEEGDVYVIKTGPKYELLAKNAMGEICMATPAISEGNLFFRTRGHVVAIGR